MKDPVQGNTSTKSQIRVTHRFSASAERVFDAWVDPARAGRWLFASPEWKEQTRQGWVTLLGRLATVVGT
jgi:hypothetical protein